MKRRTWSEYFIGSMAPHTTLPSVFFPRVPGPGSGTRACDGAAAGSASATPRGSQALADVGTHAEHGLLLEPALVRIDDFAHGSVAGGIGRMHEAEHVGRLLHEGSRCGPPLPGRLPGGQAIGEPRRHRCGEEVGPLLGAYVARRRLSAEVEQLLDRRVLAREARGRSHRTAGRDRCGEEEHRDVPARLRGHHATSWLRSDESECYSGAVGARYAVASSRHHHPGPAQFLIAP